MRRSILSSRSWVFSRCSVGLPLALVLSLFAPDLIVPLFGPNFRPTADVLRILIWYTALTMTGNVFAQGLVVQNRQRGLLAIRAAGLAINITLNALLIPRIGIIGAAVASLSAEVLVLLGLVYTFKAIRWPQLMPRLVRLAVLTVVVAVVMLLLGQVHPVVAMAIGPLLYVVGMARVLGPDDWDLLYRLVAAMPGGTFIRRFWQRDVAINW